MLWRARLVEGRRVGEVEHLVDGAVHQQRGAAHLGDALEVGEHVARREHDNGRAEARRRRAVLSRLRDERAQAGRERRVQDERAHVALGGEPDGGAAADGLAVEDEL
eukprot:4283030-Prymnesium_polylepis.1